MKESEFQINSRNLRINAMIYAFLQFMLFKSIFASINKYFKKNHHHLFNNQSLELSSLIEIDNIIQEEDTIFKRKLTKGLPKVSKLIDSVISKREGDRRKCSFLERKKYCIKKKMDSL